MSTFEEQPDPVSWSFESVRVADRHRAEVLENAPRFLEIVARIATAASDAVKAGSESYYWQWEPHGQWEGFKRAVFQFPIDADLFDFFWNARSGFRAQFWLSPTIGALANALIAEKVTVVLPADQRLWLDHSPIFDSVMSKCWFAETIKKL